MRFFVRAAVGWVLVCVTSNATADFIGANQYSISEFCQQQADRKTLVYFDKGSLKKDETDWARRLDEKLRSNILPHESVTVVELDTSNGSAREVWSACWPDYTEEEKASISPSFFGRNPIRDLKEQQPIFRNGLAKALTTVYKDAIQATKSSGSHQDKQLARAFMADESRFSSGQGVIRVIVYSEMAESSDLGKVPNGENPTELGKKAAGRLGFNADNAIIYAFGPVGAASEKVRAFWTAFFQAANGYLADLSPDLKLPGKPPVVFHSYDVEVKIAGQTRFGRMKIIADDNGQIQDSFRVRLF